MDDPLDPEDNLYAGIKFIEDRYGPNWQQRTQAWQAKIWRAWEESRAQSPFDSPNVFTVHSRYREGDLYDHIMEDFEEAQQYRDDGKKLDYPDAIVMVEEGGVWRATDDGR